MFLMIDNYDSFVYNLVRYFEELGEQVEIFRNDEITIEFIEKIRPEGIIISPGPKNPDDSGICTEVVHHFKGKIPILGICLGHQIIAQYFGGKIEKGTTPMHGKLSKVIHRNEGIFKGIKNEFNVTRYHSLVVSYDGFPSCLRITAKAEDGTIMGIKHRRYCIEGVQFHPEAELTEYGHELLQGFIVQTR